MKQDGRFDVPLIRMDGRFDGAIYHPADGLGGHQDFLISDPGRRSLRPSHVFTEVALMAAEESVEYF